MNFATSLVGAAEADWAVRGSNHIGMRQFNERTVLQAIRLHGPLPKADLSRLTQLSKQTVSIIVERMLDEGLLLKLDRLRGGIGQPSVPLALNPEGAYSIGVQIGRRSLEIVLVNFVGQIERHLTHHYDTPLPEQVLPLVEHGLAQLRAGLGVQWDRVVGLGLATPTSMHQWADVLGPQTAQALAQWADVEPQTEMQKLTALPVVFARDTVAACTAELILGKGQNWPNFLYVFVGTFVGGGLVLQGRLIHGSSGNAGAIGSLPLHLAGPSDRSCQLLEVASAWQLERTLKHHGLDPNLVFVDEICAPVHQTLVQPWLAASASALAMTATAASALLDIDALIVDGSISAKLLDALCVRTHTSMADYPSAGLRVPTVVRGAVGMHARALGGALLPLHGQFFPDKDIFLKQS